MSAPTGGGAGDPFELLPPARRATTRFPRWNQRKLGTPIVRSQFDPFGTTNPSTPAGCLSVTLLLCTAPGEWARVLRHSGICGRHDAAVLAILAFAVGGSATDTMFHNYAICGWAVCRYCGFPPDWDAYAGDNRRDKRKTYIENPMHMCSCGPPLSLGRWRLWAPRLKSPCYQKQSGKKR